MAQVEVDVTVKADIARIWIDGVRLKLTDGAGTARVQPGNHHALSWAVKGAPGTSYSIKITAPSEARLTRGDTFDEDAFDAGVAWFKVKEA